MRIITPMVDTFRIPFIVILAFQSSLFLQQSSAQSFSSSRFISAQWTMDEGLPQSSVNSILQTKDGYLWLATFGGLTRFNGESFTVFNQSNTRDIRSDRVLKLYDDRSGALWFSTERGFSRLKDGVVKTFTIVDETHEYSPLMMVQDSLGGIWISAYGKPYRFYDSLFLPVPVLKDSALARAAVNDPRGVWIAHRLELLRSIGDSIVLVKDFTSELKYSIQSVVEFPENSGNVWLASTGDGVIRYVNGTIQRYTMEQGLPSNYMYGVYVDRSGNLWATGFNGISKYVDGRFVPLRTVDGKADTEINTLFQDREGNYWGGAPSKGLFRLTPALITTIDEHNGLKEGKMLSLMRRKDGTFLFGTNCGGIYEWNGKNAVYSAINAKLLNLCVWSIFEDSRRDLWVGSRILSKFDQRFNTRTIFDSSQGFNGVDIFAITEDSRGRIWIGCLNGLYVYDGRTFRQYDRNNGLTGMDVRTLFEDASGTMWVGTTNGLFTIVNDRVVPVPLTVHHGEGTEVQSMYVRAIHQDASGAMWFGTYGWGILRLKEGKLSNITTHEGLFDNIVSHIIEDEYGFFWMGSNRGLSRVSRENLNSVADGTLNAVQVSVFGTVNGMKSPETNGGFQPSIARDDSGNLYIPTVNGVSVVSTRLVKKNDLPPPVVIERVTKGGGKVVPASDISLSYDSATVQIDYAALSYSDPKMSRFKFRLSGYDNDWVDAGTRRTAYYSNISPGTHTFQVIGSNNDGVWNTVGASIHITVRPPFWRTWWFTLLAVLFFLSFGPTVYYVRVSKLQKEQRMQQQFAEQLIQSQEQERRRIAADLHDGLGQQILIIKNRVELALKSVNDPEKTAHQLREISLSTQSSLNDVRAISHGLRPVHLEQFGLRETLLNLCEQFGQASSLEFVHHIDEIDGLIPAEQEINFYRIVQEGVNNILKHSGATQASFMIRCSGTVITASLWDNGKGFITGNISEGLGLTGIRERAKIMGGTCDIKSIPGEGTTVLITVPMQRV
jgi:signal transduction histidine kinase